MDLGGRKGVFEVVGDIVEPRRDFIPQNALNVSSTFVNDDWLVCSHAINRNRHSKNGNGLSKYQEFTSW